MPTEKCITCEGLGFSGTESHNVICDDCTEGLQHVCIFCEGRYKNPIALDKHGYCDDCKWHSPETKLPEQPSHIGTGKLDIICIMAAIMSTKDRFGYTRRECVMEAVKLYETISEYLNPEIETTARDE